MIDTFSLVVMCVLCILVGTKMKEDDQSHHTYSKEIVVKDYVPIIGILSNAGKLRVRKYGGEFVRSEYVRFLQMGGADVVVLETGQSNHSFPKLFNKINGVFLTGGGADLLYSLFANAATQLMENAEDANDSGNFFPILGTCLGIQFMVTRAAGRFVVGETDSQNMSIPLILSSSAMESTMMSEMPPNILKYLTQENITANFHKKSLLLKTYNETESINKYYRVISTNMDRNGEEFVSTIEAYKYPFYGVQWHPEKPIFVKDPSLEISRSLHAMEVGQHFANFIVNQARKNKHTVTEEERRDIVLEYNHSSYCLPRTSLHNMCGACRCCITPPNTWFVVIITATITSFLCLVLSCLWSSWPSIQHYKKS